LLSGLAIVWAGFLVENSIMLRESRVERGEASALLENALPSVEYLSDARGQLLRINGCLAEHVSDKRASDCVRDARTEMGAALSEYQKLPTYPGEPLLFDKALRSLRQLDAESNTLDRDGQRQKLIRTVSQVDEKLRAVTLLNARQAHLHAEVIGDHRESSAWLELLLDCISVLVVTVATLFALRVARRYMTFLEEKSNELEQFSSRVAHDLMSPLSTVALALSMDVAAHARPSTKADLALASLRRVRGLVEALFEFARAGAHPSGERVRVDELVEQLLPELEEQAVEAKIDLSLEGHAPPLEVACAPGVLISIICNLVRNAIKFMGASPKRTITVRARPGRGAVRFEVEDSGPGIPVQLQDFIFEPHARVGAAGQPGLGIGLATVKRLVTAHGGVVGVRSDQGQGALFWFELPTGERQPARFSLSPAAHT
jgi:signal transduction histidine kinase